MQLLLVLFFFPLLPRFFFLFFFFSPVQIRKLYISERGRIFIGLDFISFSYRVSFQVRVRFFVEKRSICGKIFFEGSLVRSSVSNISIRSEIAIAEFFLITDNLARYNGKLNLKSLEILRIIQF